VASIADAAAAAAGNFFAAKKEKAKEREKQKLLQNKYDTGDDNSKDPVIKRSHSHSGMSSSSRPRLTAGSSAIGRITGTSARSTSASSATVVHNNNGTNIHTTNNSRAVGAGDVDRDTNRDSRDTRDREGETESEWDRDHLSDYGGNDYVNDNDDDNDYIDNVTNNGAGTRPNGSSSSSHRGARAGSRNSGPVTSGQLRGAMEMLKYDVHKEVQAVLREQARQFAIAKVG
jgi:hypothetical protein